MKNKAGDIIFVRPKGLLFWFVRKFTSGKWGHMGLIVGAIQDHTLVVEAGINGVDINDLAWREVYKEGYSVYRFWDITDEQRQALLAECLKFVGMAYDKKAWLNFIIGKTWFGSDKEMYCSEMVYRALLKVGLAKEFYHAEKITPHNLFNLLKTKLELVEEVTF